MKRILSIALFFMGQGAVSAQQAPEFEPCGHQHVLQDLEKRYPGYMQAYEEQYRALADETKPQMRKNWADTTFTIRVVFHVLWNVAAENLHDSLLYNQIEVLNQDFRRLNADTVKTRSIFSARAGDARIQFVLADKDPQGNPTTGILRHYTTVPYFGAGGQNQSMKSTSTGGADAWDVDRYLNIWICDNSYYSNGMVSLLGFAFPPFDHPFWNLNPPEIDEQGVVMHYEVTGRNNPRALGVLANFNKGRVAVHEVGHYLGLRHIWGDGSGSDQCKVDDYLWDTPIQARASQGCSLGANTCNQAVGDLPDMMENYMDYSYHTCMNMFTKGQINVMRQSLTLYRPGITTTEINKWKTAEGLNVYQSDEAALTVEVNADDRKKGMFLELYDLNGKKLLRSNAFVAAISTVPVTDISAGIYIAIFRDEKGARHHTRKLFITAQ